MNRLKILPWLFNTSVDTVIYSIYFLHKVFVDFVEDDLCDGVVGLCAQNGGDNVLSEVQVDQASAAQFRHPLLPQPQAVHALRERPATSRTNISYLLHWTHSYWTPLRSAGRPGQRCSVSSLTSSPAAGCACSPWMTCNQQYKHITLNPFINFFYYTSREDTLILLDESHVSKMLATCFFVGSLTAVTSIVEDVMLSRSPCVAKVCQGLSRMPPSTM